MFYITIIITVKFTYVFYTIGLILALLFCFDFFLFRLRALNFIFPT